MSYPLKLTLFLLAFNIAGFAEGSVLKFYFQERDAESGLTPM